MSEVTVEKICSDLDIEIIPTHVTRGPFQTKAGQTLRSLLRDHGSEHVVMLLRTITETAGNENALVAPCLFGISDLMIAHPDWPNRGLAWLEAFDDIDLVGMMASARANKKAVSARATVAALIYEKIAPKFAEEQPPRRRRQFVHTRTTKRYAGMVAKEPQPNRAA